MYKAEFENEIIRFGRIVYRTPNEDKSYNKIVLKIQFVHEPNYVRRSKFTGLPTAVGATTAVLVADGEPVDKMTTKVATAYCWVNEPFTLERGEYVSTGRLLKKKLNLPSKLADDLEMTEGSTP